MEHNALSKVSRSSHKKTKREPTKIAFKKIVPIEPKPTNNLRAAVKKDYKKIIDDNEIWTPYMTYIKSNRYLVTIRQLGNGNQEYFFIEDPFPFPTKDL